MTCCCRPDHAAVRHCFRLATSSMGTWHGHAPAWFPRLYNSQLDSGRDQSVAPRLGQWSVVTHIFDAVLYAMRIVAIFYKVQYEHIKLGCGVLCTCVCFTFPWVYFCHELAKWDDAWLSYHKYKKGDIGFLGHSIHIYYYTIVHIISSYNTCYKIIFKNNSEMKPTKSIEINIGLQELPVCVL